MKLKIGIAAAVAVFAFCRALGAGRVAAGLAGEQPGHGARADDAGSAFDPKSNTEAYGKYCKGQSKMHVKGQKARRSVSDRGEVCGAGPGGRPWARPRGGADESGRPHGPP